MSGSHESWFEKLIREATEAGDFDGLPGAGKPIKDLNRPYDSAWWARSWITRETVAEAARDIDARVRRELPKILAGTDEAAMASHLKSLNDEIDAVNERLAEPDRLAPLDVDALIMNRASRRDS